MVDKNQAIIEYLITCPSIKDSPLYFNFIQARDNNKQIITMNNDKVINRRYIDGSVLKQYSYTIVDFKSLAYKAVVKTAGYQDENVLDMATTQSLIDWISEQNEQKNYPNFGKDCIVEEIRTTTENPMLDGVDTSTNPALVQYSITVEVVYLDVSKVIWKRGE